MTHSFPTRRFSALARLDDLVDEAQPLVEGPERALHGVDGEPLQVGPAVPERLAQRVHLARHRHVANEAVVGVDRDPEPEAGEQVDRSEEHTSELQSLMRISYAVL